MDGKVFGLGCPIITVVQSAQSVMGEHTTRGYAAISAPRRFLAQSKMDAVFMMGGVWMAFLEQQETPYCVPRSSTILNFPAPLFDLFEATVEASLFRAARKRDIGKFLGSTCLVL